jgi:hypothetical protein
MDSDPAVLIQRVQRCCAGDADLLRAILLETAARALVYPQVAQPDETDCVAALRAACEGLPAPAASKPNPAAPPVGEAQAAALECVKGAIEALSKNPEDLFEPTVRAYERSQAGSKGSRFHKFLWAAWLDDSVTRAGRLPHAQMLDEMARCVGGSVPIDGTMLLEGVGVDSKSFEVWSRGGVRGKLVRALCRVDGLELVGDTLHATIADTGFGVADRLRVELFVEHLIHRLFLNDRYRGLFAKARYRIGSTGVEWENPA